MAAGSGSRMRQALLAGAAIMLVGCSQLPVMGGGPNVDAATYHVGDRWVYQAQEGFRTPVRWEETREIVSAGPEGYTVRVTQRGPAVDKVRMEQWSTAGHVKVGALFDDETRRFEQDLQRYEFPLEPGKTWNQWVRNYNEDARRTGEINRYVRVGGWRSIETPAGTFDAIALEIVMQLDDDEFWRGPTNCTYRHWYAPAVKAVVREEKEAQYRDKSGMEKPWLRSQHGLLELTSFAPGKS